MIVTEVNKGGKGHIRGLEEQRVNSHHRWFDPLFFPRRNSHIKTYIAKGNIFCSEW
jgi:hypothetical protein